MTIRKLIALLSSYTVGASDDDECEVSIDTEEGGALLVDMGSDIHRIRLDDNGSRE